MQYYIRYSAQSNSVFGGPFGSHEEAIEVAKAEVPETFWSVVPSYKVSISKFRYFVQNWYSANLNSPDPSQFAPLMFYPEAVESRRLQRVIEKELGIRFQEGQ